MASCIFPLYDEYNVQKLDKCYCTWNTASHLDYNTLFQLVQTLIYGSKSKKIVVKKYKHVSVIIIFIALCGITYPQNVYWEPENPVQGGQVTIFYNLEGRGILPNSTNPVYIHLGFDGWNNTIDYTMTKSSSTGLWEYDQ
jgi:hypothetical protein